MEESTLWLNRAVYTLTFGIKSKCRPFLFLFLLANFRFYIDIIYFEAYLTFYVMTIVQDWQMGESIIYLLGPLRGVEGSIMTTMEGWKGLLWPQWWGGRVHCGYEYNSGRVHYVAKPSSVHTHLWYQIEVQTFLFVFLVTNFHFNVDIVYFKAYLTFLYTTIFQVGQMGESIIYLLGPL